MQEGKIIHEIINLLNNKPINSNLLNSGAGEKILEDSVRTLLNYLLNIRKNKGILLKNTTSRKLDHYYEHIIALLKKKELPKPSELVLKDKVQRLFMAGQVENCDLIKMNILDTAEEWINSIKSFYDNMNNRNDNLIEECIFWKNIDKKLNYFNNLACSEEYSFLQKCLKQLNFVFQSKLLQHLLNNKKIEFLIETAEDFYGRFNENILRRIYCIPINNSENTLELNEILSISIDDENIQMYENFAKKIEDIVKIPLFLKNSFYIHLINLNTSILNFSFANLNMRIFEVFLRIDKYLKTNYENYESLPVFLYQSKMKSFDTIRCFFEGICLVKSSFIFPNIDFEHILEYIKKLHKLISKDIRLIIDAKTSSKNGVILEDDIIHEYFSEINVNSLDEYKKYKDTLIQEYKSESQVVWSFIYRFFNERIHALLELNSLKECLSFMINLKEIFKNEGFMDNTREYRIKIANELILYIQAQNSKNWKEIIEITQNILEIQKILFAFEDVYLFKELKEHCYSFIEKIMIELDKNKIDLNEHYILIKKQSLETNSIRVDENIVSDDSLKLGENKCLGIHFINEFTDYSKAEEISILNIFMGIEEEVIQKARIISALECILKLSESAEKNHSFLNLIEKYSQIRDYLKIYNEIIRDEPIIFKNEEIEDYFLSLVNLKWKYFEMQNKFNGSFSSMNCDSIEYIGTQIKNLNLKYHTFKEELKNVYEEYSSNLIQKKSIKDFDYSFVVELLNKFDISANFAKDWFNSKINLFNQAYLKENMKCLLNNKILVDLALNLSIRNIYNLDLYLTGQSFNFRIDYKDFNQQKINILKIFIENFFIQIKIGLFENDCDSKIIRSIKSKLEDNCIMILNDLYLLLSFEVYIENNTINETLKAKLNMSSFSKFSDQIKESFASNLYGLQNLIEKLTFSEMAEEIIEKITKNSYLGFNIILNPEKKNLSKFYCYLKETISEYLSTLESLINRSFFIIDKKNENLFDISSFYLECEDLLIIFYNSSSNIEKLFKLSKSFNLNFEAKINVIKEEVFTLIKLVEEKVKAFDKKLLKTLKFEEIEIKKLKIQEKIDSYLLKVENFRACKEEFLEEYRKVNEEYNILSEEVRSSNYLLFLIKKSPILLPSPINLMQEYKNYAFINKIYDLILKTSIKNLEEIKQKIISDLLFLIEEKKYSESETYQWFFDKMHHNKSIFLQKFKNNQLMIEIFDFFIHSKPIYTFTEFISKKLSGTNIKIMDDLNSRIIDNIELFSYIPLLNEFNDFFDNNIPIVKLLCDFTEEKILEAINKSKLQRQISEYLLKEPLNILKEAVACNFSKFKIIKNLQQIEEMNESAINDHNLIVKFNKYSILTDRLEHRESAILQNIEIFAKIKRVQDDLLELSNAYQGKISASESKSFFETFQSFSNLISSADFFNLEELNKIDEKTKRFKKSLKTILGVIRDKIPRLYFVSDTTLMRIINDKNTIPSVLKEIYNINHLLIDDDHILGIIDQNDHPSIIFQNQVCISGKIEKIFQDFESEIKNTVKSQFFLCKNSNLRCIRDLIIELNYFKPINDAGNDNFDSPFNSNKRIEIQSESNTPENDIYNRRKEVLYRIFEDVFDEDVIKLRFLETYAPRNSHLFEFYPKPYIKEERIVIINREYDFSYFPPTDFVYTTLTSKIFSMFMISLKRCGLILYGPSGTGKTESVKYLCRCLRVPLYTFCCSETVKADSILNIIEGCRKMKCYICFDEFNRLSRETMSSVTEIILKHKSELKVFLTMNLGYKGRSQLPKSLKEEFMEIRVHVPDIKDIIYHYTGNYKLFDLLERLRSECDKKDHYDFGLRALKAILLISKDENFYNPKNDSYQSLRFDENQILKNLIHFYSSMLIKKDHFIFENLLKEIYKKSILDFDIVVSFESCFNFAISKKNGILILGKQVSKKFSFTLDKKGVFSNIPKSVSVIETNRSQDSSLFNLDFPSNLKIFFYNASNLLLTNDSIFGSINAVTKEWQDSSFVSDLRNSLGPAWFVFESPIKSQWIEDFNSILDENKAACLASGERIKINEQFKFIFLTEGIEHATPATLTRVFLISSDDIESGLKDMTKNKTAFVDLSILEAPEESSEILTNIQNRLSSEQNAWPSIIQCKCIQNLTNLIKKKHLLFIGGEKGSSKKFIVKSSLNSNIVFVNAKNITAKLFLNQIILENKNNKETKNIEEETIIYVEDIKLDDEEYIQLFKEFEIYRRIGELNLMNLKIIVGIDSLDSNAYNANHTVYTLSDINDMEDSYIFYLKNLYYNDPLSKKSSEDVMESNSYNFKSIDENMLRKIIEFFKFIQGSMKISIRNIFKLLSLLKYNNKASIKEYLLFIYSLVHSNKESIVSYLENSFESKMNFNVVFGGSKMNEMRFSDNMQKICFLLANKLNFIIKGPRLSGKYHLLQGCIKLMSSYDNNITDNIIIHHWSLDKIVFNCNKINIILAIDRIPKYFEEECYMVEIKEKDFSINPLDLIRFNGSFNKENDYKYRDFKKMESSNIKLEEMDIQLISKNTSKEFKKVHIEINQIKNEINSIEKDSSILEDKGSYFDISQNKFKLSINDNYYHPNECKHDVIRFTNSFKYFDYLLTFEHLFAEFELNLLKRKLFLLKGISAINSFKKDSSNLDQEIQAKSLSLNEQQKNLEKIMFNLDKEKIIVDNEEKKIKIKRMSLKNNINELQHKKSNIESMISEVEAILSNSKQAINNISKAHLSEIKMMGSPPKIIKQTISCLYLLLESSHIQEWQTLLTYIKKDDFINKILSFCKKLELKTDSTIFQTNVHGACKDSSFELEMKEYNKELHTSNLENIVYDKKVIKIIKELMKSEDFNNEKAEKASKACGSLFKWIKSIVEYFELVEKVLPMKKEAEEFSEIINKQQEDLDKEEKDLKLVITRQADLINQFLATEKEYKNTQEEINELSVKKTQLLEIVQRMDEEIYEWKWIECSCPINEMVSGETLIKYKKNIFYSATEEDKVHKSNSIKEQLDNSYYKYKSNSIAERENESERKQKIKDISRLIKESVFISMNDKNFVKILSNAKIYETNLFIKNVNSFDNKIYELLKERMLKSKGIVILQSDFKNIFSEELYEYKIDSIFQLDESDKIKEYENTLLEQLADTRKDLMAILNTHNLLTEERSKTMETKALKEFLKHISQIYAEINQIFLQAYKIPCSVEIFQNYLGSLDFMNMKYEIVPKLLKFYSFSFSNDFFNHLRDKYAFESEKEFVIEEINVYSFDYTIITSFNDAISRIRQFVKIDEEVSAGSLEANNYILKLFDDKENKQILIKNANFMPQNIKNGNNRFIYIIENGETHPLIHNTRIVFYDRLKSYYDYYKSIKYFFNEDNFLIRFHAACISIGCEFSLNDLKTILIKKEFNEEYLLDLVYYNRLEKDQIKKIHSIIESHNFETVEIE